LALLPLKPLFGFLPSGIKSDIEAKFGISARSSTFFSIWLELVGFFLVGIITWVYVYEGLSAMAESLAPSRGNLAFTIAVVVVLLVDVIFRYGSYLREDRSPYGFCEWLLRRRPISGDSQFCARISPSITAR
jgi:hypothetical protein